MFSNYPFLSSFNFSRIVDLNLPIDKEIWKLEEIQTAKSIFVQNESLDRVLEILNMHSQCKYILCGNSDMDVFEINAAIPASVKAIFIQNSFIRNNSKIHPLPIGIENISYARNGFKWTMKRAKLQGSRKLLVGPFGPTNQIREAVEASYKRKSTKHFRLDFPVSPLCYAKIHRKYSFTLP